MSGPPSRSGGEQGKSRGFGTGRGVVHGSERGEERPGQRTPKVTWGLITTRLYLIYSWQTGSEPRLAGYAK